MLTKRILLTVPLLLLTASCSSSSANHDSVSLASHTSSKQGAVIAQAMPAEPSIKVVYPTPNTKVPASSTFIIGACTAGDKITCNGTVVNVNAQGFFAHVVALKPGENNFVLTESGSVSATRNIKVNREIDPPVIADNDIRINANSISPAEDRGVKISDIIELSVTATPDSSVFAQIGKRKIPMRTLQAAKAARAAQSASKKLGDVHVNIGMDTAYGQVFQRHPHAKRDQYFGYYKVMADDLFVNQKVKITLSHGDKTIEAEGAKTLTTVEQPLIAETAHDATIVRLGPNASRTTPLVSGIRLLVDAWLGDQMSCVYANGKHVWIDKKDLNFENESPSGDAGSGPPPFAQARTINIKSEDGGEFIAIPLNQRLPYQVEQSLNPNQLKLHIFGVTANTDWVSDAPATSRMVDSVSFAQKGDNNYEVTIALRGHRQWGYRVDYEAQELRLHVKKAPKLNSDSEHSLAGLLVCVDPGHGGAKEKGAMGCSGICEAQINLGISLKFKDLLEAQGAKVIMTRITDTEVSLDDRVKIADSNNVDLLLSVHNNSLPDGRDPLNEHGSSTYWYHPQSSELGKALKIGLVQKLGFPDIGSRFQNLALARPSAMPAVLSEVGFMINPDEYAILISEKGQQEAAQGLLNGLKTYLLGDGTRDKVKEGQ